MFTTQDVPDAIVQGHKEKTLALTKPDNWLTQSENF
jgi:hypothetical protein